MSLFKNTVEGWQRLDWQIIRDGGIALYWRQEYLADDIKWLKDHNYDVYQLDCERWRSEDEMYSEMGRVLRFSEWWGPRWGHNTDALRDCLTDLPVREDGGAVLVLHRFDIYAGGPGAASANDGHTKAEAFLDLMVRCCRIFLLTGRGFITLLQTNDPKIMLRSIGAVSPVWNHREWLTKNRSVAD